MFVGRCSQCGGQVFRDMEGNLCCTKCGSKKLAMPVIDMPPPLIRKLKPTKGWAEGYWFQELDEKF